ncbi:hypothetical protein LAh6_56 [Aeromonas phage LAh_6]|uniref:Uncharacterized protein n=2 Tax=Lahexavirus TaxID=2843411 RepID=A0A514A044_9CAUD|nr:hypothetical protein HWC29_gp151 [Aeromonas phage 4_4572]YP_009847230.1 hypothetical protein HWC30_gp056 [Aeromonas phage LAh_6]QDH46616.1 hypothetical protein LAh6_56 [Aeromonas phage LAh_6]QEG09035.1 hypothetical protein [Aeromonas phage 4_4572]
MEKLLRNKKKFDKKTFEVCPIHGRKCGIVNEFHHDFFSRAREKTQYKKEIVDQMEAS